MKKKAVGESSKQTERKKAVRKKTATVSSRPKSVRPSPLIEDLAADVAEGRLVPFVGSGVSRGVDASQFPSWSGLLTSLAQVAPDERKQRIIRDLADDGDLYDAAEKATKFLGKDKFHSVMQRIFGARQSTKANLAVPTALWGLKPKLIVTTNYDRVLTWANNASQIATNDQSANLAQALTNLLYRKKFCLIRNVVSLAPLMGPSCNQSNGLKQLPMSVADHRLLEFRRE